MKKLSYLLASAAVLAACQPSSTYKINGTLVDELELVDSTQVILTVNDGTPQGKILDSTYVINNVFAFEGVADSVQNAMVIFIKPGEKSPAHGINFYLESGKLNMASDKEANTTLSGTPTNELLNSFQKQMAELQKPIMDAYQAMQDPKLTEEDKAAKMEAFKTLRSEAGLKMEEITKSFIQTNIGTVVGHDLFCNYYEAFTPEEQEALFAALPANLANSPAIQQIKKTIELEKKTAVGQPYTDFTLQTPEGKDLKLSDIVSKNKVTLIDFWASWCGPCRAEMPNVVKAYKDFKGKGFEIVGVSLDNNAEAWKQSIKDLGMTWPQMSDLKGWQCEGAALYNVRGIPATYLVGQDGTILAKNLRGEELSKKLAEVLK